MEKKVSELLTEFACANIGVPFVENGREARTGWDCWGLCAAAFKTLNVDLEVYESVEASDYNTAKREFEKARELEITVKNWIEVKDGDEQPGDLIYFRPAHLGVVISKGKMIHVLEGIGTCLTAYNSSLWKHRILGIYRYGKLS